MYNVPNFTLIYSQITLTALGEGETAVFVLKYCVICKNKRVRT